MTFSEAVDYLTPDELSRRWKQRISVGTLANWRSRGYGPAFVKLGSRVVYSQAVIAAWEVSNSMGAQVVSA